MRIGAALCFWAFLAATIALASPTIAQDASPVTATIEDAERVYLTFETIGLLTELCATETLDEEAFKVAEAGWLERNRRTRQLADRVLEYLGANVDTESLAPRAEADTDALLESIVPKPELCQSYLGKMTAGEMDLKTVVPDLYSRLVVSDGAIAAMQRSP